MSTSSARPSSSSSSVRTFASSNRTPIIPSRGDSLAASSSSPPSPLIPPSPTTPTSSTSSQQTSTNNAALLPTSDKDIVGVNTVYSLGQAGERLEREERLKKKGSWDEERELEEVLQEIGAGFDDGEFRLGGPAAIPLSRAHSKKDKLLIVLGLPLPPSQPSTPSVLTAASLPSPTTPSSPLPPLPSSLTRRPSSPLRSTTKLPTPPFTRRPSLPPAAPPAIFAGGGSSSSSKGPLPSTSIEKPPNGFSHSRRTSLNLGFGIAIHLGGNSTASLSSPTGSSSSPTVPTHPAPTSPRVTFHNNTSNHPSSSSSTPSLASSGTRSAGNGTPVQSPLATSMSSFSFGASSSSSHSKPRRGLVGSASSSSLREDPLSPVGGPPPPTKVGKSGSKRDLAGFLGRRRGEGEGHAMGRSISSSGANSHGHRDKSPSMFPLQSLLKQTFASSSSSSSSSTTSLHPQAPTPNPTIARVPSPTPVETWTPPTLLVPPSSSPTPPPAPPAPPRTPTPTQTPTAVPSTHLLASALRIERLLSPNPSALALAASNPTHEFFLADPPSPTLPPCSTLPSSLIFHHPTFSPYQSDPSPPPIVENDKNHGRELNDHDWIEQWILTGQGNPSEEISRRVREERRRLPLWKGPSPPSQLPRDDHEGGDARNLSPPSRSSSTSTAGDRNEGDSSGEESGALATPSTSSPSFANELGHVHGAGQEQVGMGGRELRVWEEKQQQQALKGRRLGAGGAAVGVEEEAGWKEEEERERERERDLMERLGGGTRLKINLVPASPGGAAAAAANRF